MYVRPVADLVSQRRYYRLLYKGRWHKHVFGVERQLGIMVVVPAGKVTIL